MPQSLRRLSLPAVPAFLAALVLGGCGQPSGQQHGGGMAFPPAQVTTEVVQTGHFPVAFEYVAQAVGSKDAEVRSRVTGIVEKRLYQEGARVRAGQPMFLLDPKPYEAQVAAAEAEVARADAEKARADREVHRLKPLAERRAIGQKEADDAQSQSDLAAAAIKAAQARLTEARLNLSYTRVTAPISGITGRAQQSEGSLANANTTLLATISQIDPIWVAFAVSENDRLRMERARTEGKLALPKDNGYAVEIRLSDGTQFPRPGRIDFQDVRVNPSTGTYEMRATVANADGMLKPGQYLRVALKGAERRDAITVPQVAVMDGPQGKFVYTVGKNEKGMAVALPRPVVVGDWTPGNGGNRWVIESGLKPGEEIIVDGMARLMPGAPIQVGGAPAGAPGTTAPGGAPAGGSAPAGAGPAAQGEVGKAPAEAKPDPKSDAKSK